MIATAKGHQKFGKTDALMSFLRVFITMIFFVKFFMPEGKSRLCVE